MALESKLGKSKFHEPSRLGYSSTLNSLFDFAGSEHSLQLFASVKTDPLHCHHEVEALELVRQPHGLHANGEILKNGPRNQHSLMVKMTLGDNLSMENAQHDLQTDSSQFVPVMYRSQIEMSNVISAIPTLLILGFLFW